MTRDRYFFSMSVEWSASIKEVSQNDFWTEVRKRLLALIMLILPPGRHEAVVQYAIFSYRQLVSFN